MNTPPPANTRPKPAFALKCKPAFAISIWLLALVVGLILIARAHFSADLSAFLPRAPTPAQQVLMDQLHDGMAARLIVIGIEGGDAQTRADISRALAAQLRANPLFASVENGESAHRARDAQWLRNFRYVLSPQVTPARFTTQGLHAAIADSIDTLGTPAGMLMKDVLPFDPTGEIVAILDRIANANKPNTEAGIWVSRDGARALLLAQTALPTQNDNGNNSANSAEQAVNALHTTFAALTARIPQAQRPRLLLTGAAVFTLTSRDAIRHTVHVLSTLSVLGISLMLLFVYRSPLALLLGLLPVASGIIAGIAAVSLGYDVVHGITLGFGTALLGEAVDYSIYLFMQAGDVATAAPNGARRIDSGLWPTITLGVLTSICGFGALLFSDLPGLSQLGLYAICGLATAALVTRFVLPHVLPANFRIRDVTPLGLKLDALVMRMTKLRYALFIIFAAACVVLFVQRDHLWRHELSALNPVPLADQALDTQLRADLGASDSSVFVVVSGATQQDALQQAERVETALQPLIDDNVISGLDSPAHYLPSLAAQRARLAALPDAGILRARVRQATQGLPVHADKLAPFIADVEQARAMPALQRSDLDGTSFALAFDALLTHKVSPDGERWQALLPLHAPEVAGNDNGIDLARVQAALPAARFPGVTLVDVGRESYRLYDGYLRQATILSSCGLLAIALLLAWSLKSFARAARVMLPLMVAISVVIATLVLCGQQLTLLHLIGMLLIAAVGSNYALFFDQQTQRTPRMLASLLIANLATLMGFGILGLSGVPVLAAIGMTVGPGALLALIFSAMLAPRAPPPHPQT